MKLAYLILAHRDPELLQRLVYRLSHPECDIYIHLDKSADLMDFLYISDGPNVKFVPKRVKSGWGNYSLVQATLNGFGYILHSGKKYSHINLISGQDYPLMSAAQIYRFFSANPDKTYIHSLSINDNEWEKGKARIMRYSFGDYHFPGKYKLQAVANKVLPYRKFPSGIKPYGSSQWFTITPECAAYCITYIRANLRLRRFFRLTWAVDELFFQTILCNSPLKHKLVNDNLRYVEWTQNVRPFVLTIKDAGKLLNSGKMFARKFDTTVDTAILDLLDREALS